MKWLSATFLALALAGCADHWNVDRPVELVAPQGHMLSTSKPVLHKSVAATADAPRTDAKKDTSNVSLMECMSAACKEQCALQVQKQSRPKWCMYFREPIDRHALSVTSGVPSKSAD